MRRFVLALLVAIISQPTFAQSSLSSFFNEVDAFVGKHVSEGQVDYASVSTDPALQSLVDKIASLSPQGESDAVIQAFYINAYNILVIHQAATSFPIGSVQDIPGFFDRSIHTVSGETTSLNDLEKDELLKRFKDPRYHFVLVCGAIDCPPIINEAYRPETLEAQLHRQATIALNNPGFIRVDQENEQVGLSQIFEWYASDFGGSKSNVITFINQYREDAIPSSYRVSYYPYDWTLNGLASADSDMEVEPGAGNNSIRYVVSAAIPQGQIETKIFNNLYSQATGDGTTLTDRSTFYTTFITSLYGVAPRFNAGVEIRYRRVRNAAFSTSPFGVFSEGEAGQARAGITSIGPKIRWAPVPEWQNFSIQSGFWFPIGQDLEGNNSLPYIDWNGATWWTQFFNDFSLGGNFSLFTEIDLLWEDIGRSSEGAFNRLSTPATVILSYFPNPQTTLYWLNGYSPYWTPQIDYFAQTGLGGKYQITRDLEFEVLYTLFTNSFLQQNNGRAQTINLGLRVNVDTRRR